MTNKERLGNLLRLENINQFDNAQFVQLMQAVMFNLTGERLNIIANPEFDTNQMNEIMQGLLCGLSIDQVKSYAKSNLNALQMHYIRCMYDDNVDEVLIKEAIEKGVDENVLHTLWKINKKEE